MRIGIDARLYKEGLGIGRYIEQLLKHLELLDGDDEYVVFMRKDMIDHYIPRSGRIVKVCADMSWYSCAEQIYFPFILARYHLDLIHFPHFNVPVFCPLPFIVTIHDLIMIKYAFSSTSAATTRHPLIHRIKYLAYLIVLHCALWRARSIIAISHYVKNDLITILRCNAQKITVIHEGVSALPHSCESLPTQAQIPYLLNVGNAYPHKNLNLLLECAELMRSKGLPYRILLCGQEDFFQKKLCNEISARTLSDRVVHLGRVSDTILSRLYECAFAAVFPSYEEGFGFGALEAASHGAPVIARKDGVFFETLGNAYYAIDPRNPHDILDALEQIKNKQYDCAVRKADAARRAASFDWNVTARHTHQIYHLIGHSL